MWSEESNGVIQVIKAQIVCDMSLQPLSKPLTSMSARVNQRCCRVEFVDDYKGSSFLDFGTCTFLHETKLQLKKDKVYGLLGSTMWQDHTHAGDPGGERGEFFQA